MVLKDGITHAWYNPGNETKVYNPDESIISSTGSQVGPNYGLNDNSAIEGSFLSNSSSYFKNAGGTGSFDQSLDESMQSNNDSENQNTSVKYVKNQQIVEADNCCF